MRIHALEYPFKDVTGLHVLPPGEHVQIRSTTVVANNHEVVVYLYLEPFHDSRYPGQWFYGYRLNLDANLLRQDDISELQFVARQQAASISGKLQQLAYCDFSQINVEISRLLPSTPEVLASLSSPAEDQFDGGRAPNDKTVPEPPLSPRPSFSKATPTELEAKPLSPPIGPPLPESKSSKTKRAKQTQSTAVGVKRGFERDGMIEIVRSKRPQRTLSKEKGLARECSISIRGGGQAFREDDTIAEAWETDLLFLKPDNSQLTVEGLLSQQRRYTHEVKRRGATAQMVYSWVLMAFEDRLASLDRKERPRRDENEVTQSRRSRKLGTLIVAAINRLGEDFGTDAYKICPAIAAATNTQVPFPATSRYYDFTDDTLRIVADLIVKNLANHNDKGWTRIKNKYALDPAAQITTTDLSYGDARHALGLTDTSLELMQSAELLSRPYGMILEATTECAAANEVEEEEGLANVEGRVETATEQDTLYFNAFADIMHQYDESLVDWDTFANAGSINDHSSPDNTS